jgi:pyruvyltransferase
MPRVTVVHWNPARPVVGGPLGRLVPLRRRPHNFGDLLGPHVVTELVRRWGLPAPTRAARLLTIGSIMRLARTGDTVWGSGVNGKSLTRPYGFTDLDVRAVRGPLTRDFLQARGVRVPEVYGDPGLLVGRLWSAEQLAAGRPRRPVTVVPNLHDVAAYRGASGALDGHHLLDPRSPLAECLGTIAASSLVVGSSLHGLVVAESLGIPARLVRPGTEPMFKYEDYYAGSGRSGFRPAGSVPEAVALGGEPPVSWDADQLLEAFPVDLWAHDRNLAA